VLLVLAVAVLGAGCAHVRPECAAHGGTAWQLVTSSHFSLITNLDVARAREAVLKLELARAAVLPVLQGSELSTAPLEVVLLQSGAQVADLTGADDSFASEDWRGPLLVARDDAAILASNPALEKTVHELTHVLAGRVLRRQPRWVAEGLASYLETVTVDVQERTARRGRANQTRLGDIERWNILPIEALWAWTGVEKDKPGLEQHRIASAWFWVYWLFNEQRAAFEGFLRALARGDEPGAAWRTAFPTLTTASMAAASERFRAEGKTTGQSIDLSRSDLRLDVQPLTDARVHAVLSRLAALRGDWARAAAEADTASALQADDAVVLEQVSATRGDAQARLAAATRATELAPRRAEGWLLVGMAGGDAREAALRSALELDDAQVSTAAELAALTRDVDLARHAFRKPANARALMMSAEVLARAGLCGEARTLAWRALESLPHALEPTLAAKLHGRLDELGACR
jgi:tetratricopeptide (TPR) repeat protein